MNAYYFIHQASVVWYQVFCKEKHVPWVRIPADIYKKKKKKKKKLFYTYTENLKQHYWARSDVKACMYACSTPICLKAKNFNSVALICTWEILGFEVNSRKRCWIVKLFEWNWWRFFAKTFTKMRFWSKFRFSIIVNASLLDYSL